jgi:hypothetical protein
MITPEDALEAYKKYGSKRKAAQVLGLPRTSFRRLLKKALFDEPKDKVNLEQEFKQDTATITTKSLNITNLDDALKYAKVDLNVWEVEKYTVNSWEVTMGAGKSGAEEPKTFTNYQVKVWLKRKIAKVQEKAVDALIKKLNSSTIKIPRHSRQENEVLIVPGLVDMHFGLLAWGKETGEGDYDLKIAEDLYVKAMSQAIDSLVGETIGCFLVPVGSDFFHINSPDNATPKSHNPLDVDSRLIKVFEVGQYAVIKAIERCRQVAPVKVAWVPGNHDPETSYYLCKVIQSYYRNDPNVEVDVGPQMRKFHKWGLNLIGMTHGDEEPHKSLPIIMADSCPQWWSEIKNKEWLIGHTHKKKEMSFVSIDSFGGTVIRYLPSLCKIDQWHYRKGYVGANRAAEVYTYTKNGFKSYFPV